MFDMGWQLLFGVSPSCCESSGMCLISSLRGRQKKKKENLTTISLSTQLIKSVRFPWGGWQLDVRGHTRHMQAN